MCVLLGKFISNTSVNILKVQAFSWLFHTWSFNGFFMVIQLKYFHGIIMDHNISWHFLMEIS